MIDYTHKMSCDSVSPDVCTNYSIEQMYIIVNTNFSFIHEHATT